MWMKFVEQKELVAIGWDFWGKNFVVPYYIDVYVYRIWGSFSWILNCFGDLQDSSGKEVELS